jgi:hypothetical protein
LVTSVQLLFSLTSSHSSHVSISSRVPLIECRSIALVVKMPSLLRKAKSAIYARAHAEADDDAAEAQAADQNNFVNNSQTIDNGLPPPVLPKDTTRNSTSLFNSFSSPRSHRKGRIDLSTAVKSKSNIQAREWQPDKPSSITELRRRLVRKASTFNLHSRRLGGATSRRRSEHLFPDPNSTDSDSDTNVPTNKAYRRSPIAPESTRPATASTAYSEAAETIVHPQNSTKTTRSDSISSKVTVISAGGPTPKKEVQNTSKADAIPAPQDFKYLERHTDPNGSCWGKMATTTPLPYETLKKITVEVSTIVTTR